MSSETSSEKRKVAYVGNLAPTVTSEDLCQLFALHSTPYLKNSCECELPTDANGKSKGYCFITVPEHCFVEMLNLNGIEFYGQQLVIEESATKTGNRDAKSGKTRGGGAGRGRGRGGNRGGRFGGNNRGRGGFRNQPLPNIPDGEKLELIDCGANLTNPKFFQGKGDYVFARMRHAGVKGCIVTGLTPAGNRRALLMSKSRDDVLVACGIHCHCAKDWNKQLEDNLEEWIKDDKCKCVGEVGIDKYRSYADLDIQIKAFSAQVSLAMKYKKPLLVHEREAKKEVMEVLREKDVIGSHLNVVIHCFTGSEEDLKDYVKNGFYIGITGFVCKDQHGKKLREAIQNGVLPLEQVIIQSDAPFMFPHHEDIDVVSKALLDCCSNNVNEPCTLSAVAKCLAKCYKKEPSDVAQACNKNAKDVFGISF